MSDEQKRFAQEEITKINNTQNAITIAENLIKLKGFKDVVILVNGDSVNIVVMAEELDDTAITQIQNIASTELNVASENLHIRNL